MGWLQQVVARSRTTADTEKRRARMGPQAPHDPMACSRLGDVCDARCVSRGLLERESRVNLSRNLIQGAVGGLMGASLLGLIESIYLLTTLGAPDLLSPVYAWVLYGLIGLPIGIGGGVVLSLYEKVFGALHKKDGDAIAFAWGWVAAVSPLAIFILRYLANKVVYAEAGVPLTGMAVILAIVLVNAVIDMTLGVKGLKGSLKGLLKGPGALGLWCGVALVALGASFVPVGEDPRATWAHGRGVPSGMEEAPNVLLIAVDTLRADHLGAYGMTGDISPNIDAMAADGIVFENAFAGASWTRSSFATLWSSRIPSSHKTATKAAPLPDELVLLSEQLSEHGVTTANLANNINVTSTFNFDQGWDTFIYESPAYSFGATESVFSLTLYKVVHKLNEKLGGAKEVHTFYQPAEVVLADAKGFIEANRNDRFLLGVHLMEPHDPYFEHPYIDGSGPEEFNGVGYARAEHEHPDPGDADYLKRVYVDEIKHMDNKLAPFFAWLKSEGLYDNLMIVLTADHGEEFNEHGGFWHGVTLYEEQIHVPLIVKLPASRLAGTRVSWQSRSIDIAPTITAALGVPPGEGWEGSDLIADVLAERDEAEAAAQALAEAQALLEELAPALEVEEADEDTLAAFREAEAAVAEGTAPPDPCAAYRDARHRLVIAEQDFEGNVLSAIRKNGMKYATANEGNPRGLATRTLFDVIADAGEQRDLMGKPVTECGLSADKLGDELALVLKAASEGGVQAADVELSDAEREQLCLLGYLSGPDCD